MQINSDIFTKIAPYLSIISITPARVRVRVSPKIKSLDISIDGLDEKIKQIKGIKSYKFNRPIGSLTIEYDKNIISENFWIDLINGNNSQELQQTLKELGEI